MRQAGRTYSGDGDGILSLHSGDGFLRYRVAKGECEPRRVEPFDAAASRGFRDDGVILFLSNTSANAARVGSDDPIPVTDIYRDDRDLRIKRVGEGDAMGILRDRV